MVWSNFADPGGDGILLHQACDKDWLFVVKFTFTFKLQLAAIHPFDLLFLQAKEKKRHISCGRFKGRVS
jgi:hypothetical protein